MQYNSVFLYGKVHDLSLGPVGLVEIETVKGNRSCGNTNSQYKHDIVTVITEDKHLIEEISHWDTGDMVEVKGVLVQEEVSFGTECPNCEEYLQNDCNFVYVEPVYLSRIEKGTSRKNINSLLMRKKEISNQITIGGVLTTPVQPYIGKDKCPAAVYNIKTSQNNRYFPEKKDDNIFLVRSYDKNSEQDKAYLEKGSKVFIDGSLQSYKAKHNAVCPHCGEPYKWTSTPVEIIPYSCEYIDAKE